LNGNAEFQNPAQKEKFSHDSFNPLEPFREFSTLQDRINRAFRESYSDSGRDESLAASSFSPAVDVYEDEHNITLKIEAPGIDEKDIDIRLENNTLTVHGERKIEKEEKEENFRRVESRYGSFTRTFTLPTTGGHRKRAGELR
jgi:HSP20 family protein